MINEKFEEFKKADDLRCAAIQKIIAKDPDGFWCNNKLIHETLTLYKRENDSECAATYCIHEALDANGIQYRVRQYQEIDRRIAGLWESISRPPAPALTTRPTQR
ncbi:hypothetical protein OH491_24525 [Termitidicoccus mucosus]|uniref:Uncharacterized protein n=1 Tax=Termitidicoccus mucosus TaxID=1184151 RepID=A0A178INX6_9BACT|nr:hypothetical protein AW736_01980 [Opitutaceae bacterium TSB47]